MALTVLHIVVSLVVLIGLAPLAEGLLRKFKAIIHSRQGPPITQPYLDLAKLLVKEDLDPPTSNWVWRMAPALCLGATMMVAILTPIGGPPAFGFAGDIIVFLYFATLAAVAIILGAFASGNPYAYIGGSREMMMMMSVEPVMTIALVVAAIKAHTLTFGGILASPATSQASISMAIAGVAFLLALQAQVGKMPFDITEADQEIMEGPFIERSGPGLALFRWAMHARLLIFTAVLVTVFVPWGHTGNVAVDMLFTLVKMAVVLLLVGLADVVNPRLRVDQAMAYYARIIVFVAVLALALAITGA
jgi:formate hydrogenlyase subunit 4